MPKPFKNVTLYKDHEVDVAELEVHEGYIYRMDTIAQPAAAADNSAATQLDISGGGGTMTNPKSPDQPRNIKITVTDASNGITGTVTVTGKDPWGNVITEVFSVAAGTGKVQTGVKIFAELTSIVIAGTGFGAGDLLDAGWQTKIGLLAKGKSHTVIRLVANKVVEAVSSSGTDANGVFWFIPTTAPDGAKHFHISYKYIPAIVTG